MSLHFIFFFPNILVSIVKGSSDSLELSVVVVVEWVAACSEFLDQPMFGFLKFGPDTSHHRILWIWEGAQSLTWMLYLQMNLCPAYRSLVRGKCNVGMKCNRDGIASVRSLPNFEEGFWNLCIASRGGWTTRSIFFSHECYCFLKFGCPYGEQSKSLFGTLRVSRSISCSEGYIAKPIAPLSGVDRRPSEDIRLLYYSKLAAGCCC